MGRTTELRRRLVNRWFSGAVGGEDLAGLRAALRELERVRNADGTYELLPGPGRAPVRLVIDYETEELRRDLIFFEDGEQALFRDLAAENPRLEEQIAAVTALAGPAPSGLTFITDRDGTVNNYCGRYRSSVQSAYNAILLIRFVRARTRNSVILTSAPLESFGLLDLSIMPDRSIVMVGSKGREFRDLQGERHEVPLEEHKQEALREVGRRISRLVREPEYEDFSLIGSAVQFKLGQVTCARQDTYGSIDPERSERYLATVRSLVDEVDPEGTVLRIEDTGKDIEIIATRDAGDRDFNKGDGIEFVDRIIGLDLDGPVLVCGDTASDVPMVDVAAGRGADLRVVFVTHKDDLKAEVTGRSDDRCVFVDCPDALVIALGTLEQGK
jgi:hypothetical protein